MKDIQKKFREVFGGFLEPHGFKYWQGIFLKLINDEIIHSVSCDEYNEYQFTVVFKVCTIYEYSIDSDTFLGGEAVRRFKPMDTINDMDYNCCDMPIDECMLNALNDFKEYSLPILSKVTTMEKVIEHYAKYAFSLLKPHPIVMSKFYLLIKQRSKFDFEEYFQKTLEEQCRLIDKGLYGEGYTYEVAAKTLRRPVDMILSEKERLYGDEKLLKEFDQDLENRRRKNLEQLKVMGLINDGFIQ